MKTIEEAAAAAGDYVRLMGLIVDAGIERNISLKLTQLGIDVDRATCVDNLRRILEPAARHECFVRIDMENSSYTERTLEIFETLWEHKYRHLGVALQSSLYRTDADVRRMNALGARVRLVKGAYKEPAFVAYQRKENVNAAFLRLARVLLDHGAYPAIATQTQGSSTRSAHTRPHEPSARIALNFRCSTASDATCRCRSWRRGIGCASTSPSAANGSPTSCDVSASGPPTSASS